MIAIAAAVIIAVTGVEVVDGAEVLVCGNAPALGAWDPTKAARMELAGDAWTATIAVGPEAELAFKFLHRGPDGDVVWEAGANRVYVALAQLRRMGMRDLIERTRGGYRFVPDLQISFAR